MPFGKPTSALPRGAPEDLWRHTLSQIPSLFGRLIYLSSLRNPNTGRYEHHGLAQIFGEDEAHAALRNSHDETFDGWLNSPLEQQKADVDLYLGALTEDPAAIVETWLRLAPYRNVVPSRARDSERELFAVDFDMLLEILRKEYRVSRPDPEE